MTSTAPILAAEPVTEKVAQAPSKAKKPAHPKADKPAKVAKPIVIDASIEIVSTKPVAAPVETSNAAPKAEKVAKPKAAKNTAAKPAPKAKPVKAVAAPAGEMQMVETKSTAKVAAPAVDVTKPKAPRKAPNWKKDAEAKTADTPLVMVETQK